jgi:large subunit ribosomal protein L4
MGMRIILSSKVKDQSLGVMSSMDWPSAKTKHLSVRIKQLGHARTLFLTGETDIPSGLQRAIGNLPDVKLSTPQQTTIYDMLRWPRLVMDLKAVEFYERTLGKHHTPSVS